LILFGPLRRCRFLLLLVAQGDEAVGLTPAFRLISELALARPRPPPRIRPDSPALAELVKAKRLDGERQQGRFLFREHGRDLAFGRPVDSGVSPAFLPAVQIGLSFLDTLESQPLQRRLLSVADATLDLSLAIRIPNAVLSIQLGWTSVYA